MEVKHGQPDFDLIIRGGSLFDGSGADAVSGDLGLKDGKIVAVGELPAGASADKTIDAAGLWVTPGFIDVHSHSDVYLFVEPDAQGKIRQGFTTEVVGQCGSAGTPIMGAAKHRAAWHKPLTEMGIASDQEGGKFWRSMGGYREELTKRGHAINVAALAGHNVLRASVMGYAGRPATDDEVATMVERLERALDEGASGFSSGLIYRPGCFSEPGEVEALAAVAAAKGGHYATHMRCEGEAIEAALDEVLALARATGIKVQISHLKTAGRENWHKVEKVLATINAARDAGLHVYADRYPYCASATTLNSRLPLWAKAGGEDEMLARINDPTTAQRLIDELEATTTPESWQASIVAATSHPALHRFRGQPVTAVAEAWQCTPIEAFMQLMRMDKLLTGGFFANMSEENMRRIYREPWVMIGTDASIAATSGPLSHGYPHPRTYGTSIRFLKLARDGELDFGVGEAVRRLTSLPATAFQFAQRGTLREGYWGDVVVIDPDKLREKSSYGDPNHYAEGVCQTIVNGKIVFDGEKHLHRPGMWLVAGR